MTQETETSPPVQEAVKGGITQQTPKSKTLRANQIIEMDANEEIIEVKEEGVVTKDVVYEEDDSIKRHTLHQ